MYTFPTPAIARWSSSATPIFEAGALREPIAAMHLGGIEVGAEQVRTEPGQRRVEMLRPRLEQLDDRGVEADRDRAIDLEHEARPTGRSTPALTRPIAMPRAVHPQVGPQFQPAVEPDQQVLALRLDRVDPLADDPMDLGHGARSLGTRRAHVPPDKVRPESSRGPEERVAFGHAKPPLPGAADGEAPVPGTETRVQQGLAPGRLADRHAVDLADDELAGTAGGHQVGQGPERGGRDGRVIGRGEGL